MVFSDFEQVTFMVMDLPGTDPVLITVTDDFIISDSTYTMFSAHISRLQTHSTAVLTQVSFIWLREVTEKTRVIWGVTNTSAAVMTWLWLAWIIVTGF